MLSEDSSLDSDDEYPGEAMPDCANFMGKLNETEITCSNKGEVRAKGIKECFRKRYSLWYSKWALKNNTM